MVRDFTATDIFQVGGLTTSWAIKRDINSSNVFNASSSTPCDFSTSFLANTTTTMALEIRDDANHNNGRFPSRVKLSRDCSHTFGSRSATELVWRSWPGVGGACAMQGRAVRPLCQRLFADLTWLARNEAILIVCLVPSSASSPRLLGRPVPTLQAGMEKMEAAQICISPFLECESGRLPLPRPWPALPALPVAEAPELAEKLISPKCRPHRLVFGQVPSDRDRRATCDAAAPRVGGPGGRWRAWTAWQTAG